jgi:hypothetical protein
LSNPRSELRDATVHTDQDKSLAAVRAADLEVAMSWINGRDAADALGAGR